MGRIQKMIQAEIKGDLMGKDQIFWDGWATLVISIKLSVTILTLLLLIKYLFSIIVV